MWNLPGPFIASCNSQACVFRCHTRFGARDPGHRSYLGALAVSSNEAVSHQIQLDELFEANNWFNFFPLVPEWSAVRFWLPEICVCEMTMTFMQMVSCSGLPISYSEKTLFLIICCFSWMTVLASHGALRLSPEWTASRMIFQQCHAQTLVQTGFCALLLLLCFCQQGMGAVPGAWGSPVPLSAPSLVSRFWQHLLGYKHMAHGSGRWGALAVGRGWSGLGWPQDSALSLLPFCLPREQVMFAVLLVQFFSKRLYMRERHHLWQL